MSKLKVSDAPMLFAREHLAKVSPSPVSEKEWMTRVVAWRSDMLRFLARYAPPGWSGRMSPACYQVGQMRRSVLRPKNPEALSKKLDELEQRADLTLKQKSAIANLRKLTKPTILISSPPLLSSGVIPVHGESLTLNTSVWRSGASVCSLSEVLEFGPIPPRYFLTANACRGILRRAAKRGRELPPALHAALTAAARADTQDEGEKTIATSSATASADTLDTAKEPEHCEHTEAIGGGDLKSSSQVASTLNSGGNNGGFRTEPGEHLVAVNNFGERSGDTSLSTSNQRLDGDTETFADPPAIAFQTRGREGGQNVESQEDVAYSLTSPSGGGRRQEMNIAAKMAVRRLTPRECERLQGFPDDYTAVTNRGKPAADGPRYRAIGNSMAVPVLTWIGKRIEMLRNYEHGTP